MAVIKVILGAAVGGALGAGYSYLTRCVGSAWAASGSPWVTGVLGAALGIVIAVAAWR